MPIIDTRRDQKKKEKEKGQIFPPEGGKRVGKGTLKVQKVKRGVAQGGKRGSAFPHYAEKPTKRRMTSSKGIIANNREMIGPPSRDEGKGDA